MQTYGCSLVQRLCLLSTANAVEGPQVNLMALQRLLDFGSGYEPLLKAATGRGARETMQFGVIG